MYSRGATNRSYHAVFGVASAMGHGSTKSYHDDGATEHAGINVVDISNFPTRSFTQFELHKCQSSR